MMEVGDAEELTQLLAHLRGAQREAVSAAARSATLKAEAADSESAMWERWCQEQEGGLRTLAPRPRGGEGSRQPASTRLMSLRRAGSDGCGPRTETFACHG